MTDRSVRTKQAIMEAAERLWADRGVGAVSARQILEAADQRNNGALRYHFGDRDGLLKAIAAHHLANLKPRTLALAAELGDPTSAEVRDIVSVLLRPSLEYIDVGPRARAWTCLFAQLLARPDQTSRALAAHAPKATAETGAELVRRLEPAVGTALAIARVRAMGSAAHHLMAEQARLHDGPGAARTALPLPVFTEMVIDMLTAGIAAAPTSALTERLPLVRQSC